MAKVKVTQRSVYHKYAEIEIEAPDWLDELGVKETSEWLTDNEDKWVDKIDHKINISEFIFGNGVDDYDGMNEPESDSEWRYETEDGSGGHL